MNQGLRHETYFKRLCVNHKQNHQNCIAEAENLVLEKIFDAVNFHMYLHFKYSGMVISIVIPLSN